MTKYEQLAEELRNLWELVREDTEEYKELYGPYISANWSAYPEEYKRWRSLLKQVGADIEWDIYDHLTSISAIMQDLNAIGITPEQYDAAVALSKRRASARPPYDFNGRNIPRPQHRIWVFNK